MYPYSIFPRQKKHDNEKHENENVCSCGVFHHTEKSKHSLLDKYFERFLSLAFFALFGPFGAIFWVWIKFKNFFGTYLHKLTTFILEV